jgi:hypothetical protein
MNAFQFFPIHAAIHADYRHAVMQNCHADYQHPADLYAFHGRIFKMAIIKNI